MRNLYVPLRTCLVWRARICLYMQACILIRAGVSRYHSNYCWPEQSDSSSPPVLILTCPRHSQNISLWEEKPTEGLMKGDHAAQLKCTTVYSVPCYVTLMEHTGALLRQILFLGA